MRVNKRGCYPCSTPPLNFSFVFYLFSPQHYSLAKSIRLLHPYYDYVTSQLHLYISFFSPQTQSGLGMLIDLRSKKAPLYLGSPVPVEDRRPLPEVPTLLLGRFR